MRALIGYTGFVGSNLAGQTSFDAFFNSANIEDIQGRRFELVVCAAAPAEKWRANADPVTDRAAIDRLTNALAGVEARSFVLISTVDVYPTPRGVDERTVIDRAQRPGYGSHRLLLEDFVRQRFDALVLRLPALFGEGLKKNALFDLLHDHEVEKIDGRGVFQFYDIGWLWPDIERARSNGLPLLNLVTEPLAIDGIARRAFRRTLAPGQSPVWPNYDIRSVHARVWGRGDGYLYGGQEVLQALDSFVESHADPRSRVGET